MVTAIIPAAPLSRLLAVVDDLSRSRHALIGAALLRITLGVTSLLYLGVHYRDRAFLWGPEGVWPWTNFTEVLAESGSLSLYALSRDPWWFTLLFHMGIIVAVLFTLGWHTRMIAVAHFLLTYSLFERNPVLLDGGDNLARIVLLYLLLVDCGARLSLDARRRRPRPADTLPYHVGSLAHHAGLALIMMQVAVLYLTSGLYKMQGEMWQNGTALYYILRVQEFTWPGVSEHVYTNGIIVTLLTYSTVLFQLAFPLLLLHHRLRLPAVLAAVALHTGIALMMGLLTFSLIMISVDLIVFGDAHYQRLGAAVRRTAGHATQAVLRVTGQRRPTADPGDGWARQGSNL